MTLPYNPDPHSTPNVQVSHLSVKSYFPNSTAPLGTWIELWFGMSSHVDPGYKSNKADTVASQVSAALARGFDFVVLDWYGTQNDVIHAAAMLWKSECEKQGLKFIIDFNKGLFQFGMPSGVDVTVWAKQMLDFAVANFMSSPAYLKHTDGRFLMCTWDTDTVKGLDCGALFAAYPQLAVIYDHYDGVSKPGSSGAYGWIGTDNSNPQGGIEVSQTSFLTSTTKARTANPALIVMASVPKGFDDHGRRPGMDPTKTCWPPCKARYRFTDEKQGQTLLNVVAIVNKYTPDYILFPTWNDYDENTASGERGIDSQLATTISAVSGVVTVEINGNANTVDHVDFYVNGTLTPLSDSNTYTLEAPVAGQQSFKLQAIAVGRPLFLDKPSDVLTVTATVVTEQTVSVPLDKTVVIPVSGTIQGSNLQGTLSGTAEVEIKQNVDVLLPAQTVWS